MRAGNAAVPRAPRPPCHPRGCGPLEAACLPASSWRARCGLPFGPDHDDRPGVIQVGSGTAMIAFKGQVDRPSTRPACHSYGSRQSTSCTSPGARTFRAEWRALRSFAGAIYQRVDLRDLRRALLETPRAARSSKGTNRTSSTAVTADPMGWMATDAASSIGYPHDPGRDRREGNPTGRQRPSATRKHSL